MLGDFVRGDINASAEPGGFNCLLQQGNHSQSRSALSSIYFRAKLAFILLRQPLVAFDGIISTPKALRPPRLLTGSSSELNNHAPSETPQIHCGEMPFSFPVAAARGPLLAPSACTTRAHAHTASRVLEQAPGAMPLGCTISFVCKGLVAVAFHQQASGRCVGVQGHPSTWGILEGTRKRRGSGCLQV